MVPFVGKSGNRENARMALEFDIVKEAYSVLGYLGIIE